MSEKIEHNVKIYESKKWKIITIVYILILYSFFCYQAIKEDNHELYWLIGIFSPLPFYYIFKNLKEINKPPKKIIVISIDGISVPMYGFIKWELIENEEITFKGSGIPRGWAAYLKIKIKEKKIVEIPIDNLSKNIFQIRRILRKYRKHYDEYVTPRYN
ncbi:protein of unknown function [Tenacibaculum sp. 190130A14a]|uniref:PH (Pleckstrin Homology) domain-containing protein n=1 Tax=Tenacibaculum polynesiense TaxID=3137857 RepID=A0ABP1F5S4_9FLAO